jgi:ATP-binding cassette, subfamily B, bacterial PglK
MTQILRKCFDLVGVGHRFKWAAMAALALVVTAVEALGAGLIFLLLALITDPTGGVRLPLVGDVQRFFPGVTEQRLMVGVAVSIALFSVIRSMLVFGQAYVQQRVVHNAGAQLATRLMRGYLAMPYAFHLQRNSAELIRNALQSVHSVITHAVTPLVRLFAELLVMVGLIAVLLSVSPTATALAAVVLGPLVWLLMRIIHPRVKTMGKRAQRAVKDSIQTAQQSLEGIRDVKLLGREPYFGREFARSRQVHASSLYTRAALAELPPALIECCLVIFIVLFFIINVVTGAEAGGTLSLLGLFAYVGLRLEPSLRKVVGAVNNLKFGAAAVEDVHADLQRFTAKPSRQGEGALPFGESLALEHVTFSYDGASRPALTDINLAIKPGEAIGICGPTGGGKSTLVDIIVGLLEPSSGAVEVDGRDIREAVSDWQRQIGVVSQAVFLLDGTLRENIAFGVEERAIEDDRVGEAVRLAQLDSFIESIPLGLETRVGERGVRLSGGQRQRVAIARALYRRPSVLVFDEGTSALDNRTEAELISALERLRGNHTLIMVAHRLSTVRRCDRILLVEDSRISDVGTFEELAARHELFAAASAS